MIHNHHLRPELREEMLLDGAAPVRVLAVDDVTDPGACLGVMVCFPGTTSREWVAPERLMHYRDPEACPVWAAAGRVGGEEAEG